MRPTVFAASLAAVCTLAVSATGSVRSLPQDAVASLRVPASVPVRIVEGKLCVRCEISSPSRRLPVNLFVDYDKQVALTLHTQAQRGLRGGPVTIHLPGVDVPRVGVSGADDDFLDEFTRLYSKELGEIQVVGTIGSKILEKYLTTFDLSRGEMVLSRARGSSNELRERAAAGTDTGDGAVLVPLSEERGLAWLTVRQADGSPGAFAFGTSRFDTVLDQKLAKTAGHPAGDIESLGLGPIDLCQYVALRPERMIVSHPDGTVGMVGLNLLQHFRVEVDRVNQVARFTETKPADFPKDDQAFFRARAVGTGDAVDAFLTEFPEARLAVEAAEELLRLRLREGGDPELCKRAIKALHDTRREDLRATVMFQLVEQLAEQGRRDLASAAAEYGIESGRNDRYPETVHKLHRELGEMQLETGELNEAWRHLLSAAYGMPEDGTTNLALGRVYEEQGRFRRAFSRYIQAVIKPDSGPEALKALTALSAKMSDEERLGADRIDRLISGKVLAFGAATTYRPEDDDEDPDAVVGVPRRALIEFFTNAYLGNVERGGAIGGALANEGLATHFTTEHAAFITWHLNAPSWVPLTTELGLSTARRYRVGPDAHVINGTSRGPGAGKWRDKDQIYDAVRRTIVRALKKPTSHTIDATLTLTDGDAPEIVGEVRVSGPELEGAEVTAVLIERRSVWPGTSGTVIHRNVARGTLLGDIESGIAFIPVDGVQSLPLRRTLKSIRNDEDAFLVEAVLGGGAPPDLQAPRIDPDEVSVVVFLRSPERNEILQCLQIDLGDKAIANGGEEEKR